MSKTGRPPNYYAILEISETASTTQIRDAYKRAALKTHPDRVPAMDPTRPERTRKFQLVNDAYYTLSDASRRREYDAQRKIFGGTSSTRPNASSSMPGGFSAPDPFAEATEDETEGNAGNGFSWAWSFFTGQNAAGAGGQPNAGPQDREQAENAQFADVFEEMLREEGMAEPSGRPTSKFWGLLGGLSGGALGFIVGNVPGLVAGAVAGNRLGAIRDAKGKSVYAVFQELPQDDRARLLSQMAAKVFSHAVGI
ncbi:hypothetical protein B0T14DRAFT_532291 [Immersiella caudata]|uniref:J domain-containing protein n=1 Tax=Immersiella caudata TaxID=314043 RepID=A0AA40CAY5_9PEZI|nr:hypothetical protein B0T14DRAFT_532291 [Immersiella caudata]